MPIATLHPILGSSFQFQNSGAGFPLDLPDPVGDADLAACLQVHGSGKLQRLDEFNTPQNNSGVGFFVDTSSIPLGATINSVSIEVWHRCTLNPQAIFIVANSDAAGNIDLTFDGFGNLYDEAGGFGTLAIPGAAYENWHVTGYANADSLYGPLGGNHPPDGLPWTLADLSTNWFGWYFTPTFPLSTSPPGSVYEIDYYAVIVDYTGGLSTAALDQLPLEVVYDFSLLADMPNVFTTTDPLPAGLTLNPDGTITGTPAVTGAFPVTVTATGPGWPIDIPVTIVTVAGVPVDEPVAAPVAEGVSIPRGPGECAGVAYGIGVLGSPGGIAGTGDPMSTVAIDLKQFFGGASNSPPALGFLRAYSAGTTTPLDTFANSSLATPNAWPIQLDADGNSPVPIFLGPFIYKFDLQTAAGASLPGFPKDNIAGSVWPGQVLGAVTVNPIANADGIGHSFSSTLNKAASGTHALFAGVRMLAPTIGSGAATLTEAATLSVAGPPLGGTTRYAVHVEQGDILLSNTAGQLGFYGHAVVAQQLFATGAGHTVDQLITVLQNLGLIKQA